MERGPTVEREDRSGQTGSATNSGVAGCAASRRVGLEGFEGLARPTDSGRRPIRG